MLFIYRGVLGKAWYWRMKILRSVLFRKERMVGPKENRVKVAEKEEEGKFRGSHDGGNVEGMMNSDKRVMAGKGEDIQYLSVLNVAGFSSYLDAGSCRDDDGGPDSLLFFVSADNIEFLEQKDPPHQSWLSILFGKEILYSRMVKRGQGFFEKEEKSCPEWCKVRDEVETTGSSKEVGLALEITLRNQEL
ncbi:hypothetical protein Tco_1163614 [Tanacetum coccineum]